MHAVMKHTIAPATKALKTSSMMTSRFPGISVLRALIMIPIAPGFEKPHTAYVAIVCDLGYIRQILITCKEFYNLKTHCHFENNIMVWIL